VCILYHAFAELAMRRTKKPAIIHGPSIVGDVKEIYQGVDVSLGD